MVRYRGAGPQPATPSTEALRDTPRGPPAPRTMIGIGDPVFDPVQTMAALAPAILTRAPRATDGDFRGGAGSTGRRRTTRSPPCPRSPTR